MLLHGLHGSSADFPVSPYTPSPTFKQKTYFCVGSSRYFFQERGTYNIVLWFCLTYHPSCETIRASFICLALVQIHCPLTQSSPCALLLLLTLLLRPGAGRDTMCFHLLLTISDEGEFSASCWIRLFSFALRLNPHKLKGMPCSDLIGFSWHLPTAVARGRREAKDPEREEQAGSC